MVAGARAERIQRLRAGQDARTMGRTDRGLASWLSEHPLLAGVGTAAAGVSLTVAAGAMPAWGLLAGIVVGLFAWAQRPGGEGREVEERSRINVEPRRSIQDVALVLDSFDLPLIGVDDDLTVTLATARARELFPALSIGRSIALALRDPDVLAAIAAARTDDQERQTIYNERGEVERVWRVRARKLAVDAGAVAILFEDLTEQRALERLRVDFIANASHELRTPLSSLLGFIETLQGPARNDAPARERFLAIMREQAARMSRLIDDLLSLSRAEMRTHQTPRAAVNLTAVVREIVDSLSLSARERGVDLIVSAPSEPVMIRGDRDDLLRMAENLIENGIKYGREGRQVEITVSTSPSGPRLDVRDHGPGIPARHIPRLTERFYRVDASHSREIGGTGLGLAIVKHIVARHNARLEVESRVGEGARFGVVFPPVGN